MIDYDRLDAGLEGRAAEYRTAWPFPWVQLDGFLRPGFAETMRDGFRTAIPRPDPDEPMKHRHVARKIGVYDRDAMTAEQRAFFDEVNAPAFIRRLEALTGLSPLHPDPGLLGGGLHEIYPGGFLNVHADFNVHPDTGRHRVLNLILYLNPEWRPEHEGCLELWPQAMDRAPVVVEPRMNRAVLFRTSEISFHGHPKPYRAPEGLPRRSLAVYYYMDWPAGLAPRSKTLYRFTPEQERALDGRVAALLRERPVGDDELPSLLPDAPPKEVLRSARRVRARP